MAFITSVQRRDPSENMTSPNRNFDHLISSNSFSVYNTEPKGIMVEFDSPHDSSTYVGLLFPSKEIAIAVGRALISAGRRLFERG